MSTLSVKELNNFLGKQPTCFDKVVGYLNGKKKNEWVRIIDPTTGERNLEYEEYTTIGNAKLFAKNNKNSTIFIESSVTNFVTEPDGNLYHAQVVTYYKPEHTVVIFDPIDEEIRRETRLCNVRCKLMQHLVQVKYF